MGLFSQLRDFFRSAESYVVEKVSCFTEVGILDDGTVRVEFEGNYYEFISINDIPVEDIIESAKSQFQQRWEKRFVEDLTQVMAGMGRHPGERVVKLVLRDPDSGQIHAAAEAPLTKENRSEVWRRARQQRG